MALQWRLFERRIHHVMYEVIKPHRSNYPDPLAVAKGQCLRLGERYTGPEDWAHWIFCTTLDKRQAGWVPEQLLDRVSRVGDADRDGNTGIMRDDYTARELDVSVGDRLTGHRELNGWVWCERPGTTEAGWVPQACLQPCPPYSPQS